MLTHVPVSRRELGFRRGMVSEETKKFFEAEIGRPLMDREARVYNHLHDCLVNNIAPRFNLEERKVIDALLDEGNVWIVAQKVYINPDFYPIMHEVIYDAYVENVLITREEFDMHFSDGDEKKTMQIEEGPKLILELDPESVMLVN